MEHPTDGIRALDFDEWINAPRTLDSLPENMRAGTSRTVNVCAEPITQPGWPFGPPCRVVLSEGRCAVHGQPRDPHRVTVYSAWDIEGNRTMTHSMWKCRPCPPTTSP